MNLEKAGYTLIYAGLGVIGYRMARDRVREIARQEAQYERERHERYHGDHNEAELNL